MITFNGEESLQQANETIVQQFKTIETLKLVVSELTADREFWRIVVAQLKQRIEYAEMKADAYRKVWSARHYIYQLDCAGVPDTGNAHRVLSEALRDIEWGQGNWAAIKEKYKDVK